MAKSIVLRRGRCGRYFAKYVQKSIFEDSDASDIEEEIASDKKLLKKRRKRYQDLFEYLSLDATQQSFSNNESVYQGLLMRDQKYLRKNMTKICQLSVKESANKILKKNQEALKHQQLQ